MSGMASKPSHHETLHNETLHNETLRDIEARLGRPLRVLHIGNIANNAYNNARIQRQYGIEADVLSYDYYHVMSTPEWEDAEFEGELDSNIPNWWATSLKGWKRPAWFVQGPVEPCLQYLRAKHLGLTKLQKLLWLNLEARCLGYVRYMAEASGKPIPPMPLRLGIALKAAEAYGVSSGPALGYSDEARRAIRAILLEKAAPDTLADAPEALAAEEVARQPHMKLLANALYRMMLDVAVLPALRDETRGSALSRLWLKRRMRRAGTTNRKDLLALVDMNPPGIEQLRGHPVGRFVKELRDVDRSEYGLRTFGRAFMKLPIVIKANRLLDVLTGKICRLYYFRVGNDVKKLKQINNKIDTTIRDTKSIKGLANSIIHFSDAEEESLLIFFDYYTKFYSKFYDIIDKYDVIQGYSIDGGICWANGLDRFISYEHGTLRDLPFGQDFYGIVTRIAYHASTYVFVTNSDVLPATERMGLDPARIVCLPHAFDDRKLVAFREQNPGLQPPRGPAVFFSPTRHHWIDTSGSWTKGNDILLRAAGIVAAEGLDFRLILVEWGKEIDDSKTLIAELGIADKVSWVGTMQKRELWEAYCRAHAVVDQFTLPALGGVGFETMALGRRLITAIDHDQLAQFFGEAPPCLAASSVDQCAARLRQVITDPDDAAGLGLAAAKWMHDYHSAERIVAIQADTYRDFLAGGASASSFDLEAA